MYATWQTRDFVGKLPALKEVWCFDLDFESRLKVRPLYTAGSSSVKPATKRRKQSPLIHQHDGFSWRL